MRSDNLIRKLLVAARGAACIALVLTVGGVLAETQTRTSSFEYHPTTGLLVAEIVEPDNPALCVRTEFVYDTRGRKSGTTVSNCGSGVPIAAQFAPRSATVTYTGNLNNTAVNAIGLEVATTYNAWDQPAQVTDANGLVTSWTYDGFGRKVSELRPDGNSTVWRYCLFSDPGSSNSASCGVPAAKPLSAVRYEEAVPQRSGVQNGPYKRTYYDAQGFAIRAETQSFDGGGSAGAQNSGVVVQDTAYAFWGAVLEQTEPYFLNSGVSVAAGGTTVRGRTMTRYDVLRRPVTVWKTDSEHTVQPTQFDDSALAIYQYPGSRTVEKQVRAWRDTAGNPVERTELVKTTEHDPLGRPIRVTDALGAQLAHQYDAVGNMVRTHDALGAQTVIGYDGKGRKISIQDPSSGLTTSVYDVNRPGFRGGFNS